MNELYHDPTIFLDQQIAITSYPNLNFFLSPYRPPILKHFVLCTCYRPGALLHYLSFCIFQIASSNMSFVNRTQRESTQRHRDREVCVGDVSDIKTGVCGELPVYDLHSNTRAPYLEMFGPKGEDGSVCYHNVSKQRGARSHAHSRDTGRHFNYTPPQTHQLQYGPRTVNVTLLKQNQCF